MKILAIDDDLLVFEMLRRWLPEHRFYFSDNLREASEVLKQKQFDLVLCDVCVPPYMRGEVADTLKAENPEIPVILISGCDEFGIEKTKEAIREVVQTVDLEVDQKVRQDLRTVIKRIKQLRALRTKEEHDGDNDNR